jgi:hypothetical protein
MKTEGINEVKFIRGASPESLENQINDFINDDDENGTVFSREILDIKYSESLKYEYGPLGGSSSVKGSEYIAMISMKVTRKLNSPRVKPEVKPEPKYDSNNADKYKMI